MKWMTFCAGGLMTLAVFGCGDGGSKGTPAAATIPGPEEAKVEADKLFVDLQTHIKNKDWYPADGVVIRLDAIKPSLSPEYVKKVDDVKKGLLAAKAAAAQGR